MTQVWYQLATMNNHLHDMDRKIAVMDKELRDLDFFARHNLYMLQHADITSTVISSFHRQAESKNKKKSSPYEKQTLMS